MSKTEVLIWIGFLLMLLSIILLVVAQFLLAQGQGEGAILLLFAVILGIFGGFFWIIGVVFGNRNAK